MKCVGWMIRDESKYSTPPIVSQLNPSQGGRAGEYEISWVDDSRGPEVLKPYNGPTIHPSQKESAGGYEISWVGDSR